MKDRRGKRFAVMLISLCVAVNACASVSVKASSRKEVCAIEKQESALRLWYDEAAPISSSDVRWWQSTALPIGNGNIGGLIFGGVAKDRIHFNEKTLWAGGPKNGTDLGSDGNPYRGGNRLSYAGDDTLENYRQRLDDKSEYVFGLPFQESNNILTSNFFSRRYDKGTYMDFGDIYLDFSRSGIDAAGVSDYVRDLDMETAVSSVSYQSKGETYQREMFVSYPDNVLVCRLTSSGQGALTFDVSLEGSMAGTKHMQAEGNKITLNGDLNDNGMKYEAQLAVDCDGGSYRISSGKIQVDNADAVTLILSAGTNYANEYPTYRGEDPSAKVTAAVDAALEKGYDELLESHLADYRELFGRVELDLGAEIPQIPTDELILDYRNGKTDKALEVMVYQYGRYLTIAGSREGTLPTNLCGMWLLGNASELWQGDYHYNVNLQMNYWPTYSTNLAECGTPLNEFIESLVVPGRYSAAMCFGGTVDENAPIGSGNGFLLHTAGNPFGGTAPMGSQEYGWNPNGGTWVLQNVYDYYRFTKDEEALKTMIYPMMKEAADFWAEKLWYSQNQKRWTVTPSVSAEQGPTAVGATYDQSLVWQLFEETIQAAEILGVDADRAAVWREKQDGLQPIMVSDAGYIKEWYEETTPGKAQDGALAEINIPNFNAGYPYEIHRHSSHLIGLYPGTLINKDEKEWMEAAKRSLIQRDFAGTGWSKAHRINLWARALDGNNAYRLIQGMLKGGNAGILTNLLDSHGNGNGNHTDYPVFQIDGNYGLTAGMTELLLQSQLGYVQLLPALPDAWESGSVTGLVARGNFVVDMQWEEKEARQIRVMARSGGTFEAEYPGIGNACVVTASGKPVSVERLSGDRIKVETKVGETYCFLAGHADTVLAKAEEAQKLAESMKDTLLGAVKAELTEAADTAREVAMAGMTEDKQSEEKLNTALEKAKSAVELFETWQKAGRLWKEICAGTWQYTEKEKQDYEQSLKQAEEALRLANVQKESFVNLAVRLRQEIRRAEGRKPVSVVLECPEVKAVKSMISAKGPKVKITVKQTAAGADAYIVYRRIGKNVSEIGSVNAKGIIYDTNPPANGKKIYYYAKAVSKRPGYTDSAAGAEKAVTLPKAPKKGKVSRSGKQAKISWTKVNGAKAYIIFRSAKKSSGYKKIATVKGKTSYVDKNAKKKYYYTVVTMKKGKLYSGMGKIFR